MFIQVIWQKSAPGTGGKPIPGAKKEEETKTYLLILKISIMQNEDDLRGLAKVTDFMRAISFLFLAIHMYWFCYGWLHEMG